MRISAAMVVMALALGGCDRDAEESAPAAAQGSVAPTVGAERGAADAVAAVMQSQGGPATQLSFLIETRPVVGKPFAVKLYLSAAEAMPGLQLSVEPGNLISTPASGTLNITGPGQAAEQDLVVTAQQAGLWELAVSIRSPDVAAATVYKIPVMVSAAG
jgi:hypothetical protein